eukprot:6189953-Pleurochrysis_carterae.AAC.4
MGSFLSGSTRRGLLNHLGRTVIGAAFWGRRWHARLTADSSPHTADCSPHTRVCCLRASVAVSIFCAGA